MGLKLARNIIFRPKFFLYLANIHSRGGVKLEFILNSFDSIRKFAIRLFPNGKKCLKNSMNSIQNSQFFQIQFSDSKRSNKTIFTSQVNQGK